MYRDKKIGVVVPAYNEEPHIRKVLQGMPDFVDAVYVVDDASTDHTADIVREWFLSGAGTGSHSGTHVELLQHPENRGVGAAIVTGYKRCLADSMDISAVMAGDNQMDPAELSGLCYPIVDGVADYTKGDRTSDRAHLAGMSYFRRSGNWLLRWLTRIAIGNMKVNDPQNGYTAASAALLAAMPLERLYPRYGYCNQLLLWVSAGQRRMIEVPMPSRYLGEKSKIRYGVYIPKVSWLLLRLWLERVRRNGATPHPELPAIERDTAKEACR
ncbi:MAG: glycosyltransferase family 2 protein [Dehalococcoidia bacterium]|nr:glycosyltransferase family 2 protein [Dehalococcoidia bacterium]